MISKNSKLDAPKSGDKPGARSIPMFDQRLESSDLFLGTREITIGHGNEVYRLRLTAQNKLILTK